jgi:uncharacterized membrane protein YeaQ/YmgE (transglycosylase-associated protein family)
MHVQQYTLQANMPEPKNAGRILVLLTIYSSSAIDAYGWSSASLLHPSVKQEELTMSFVVWIVLGLVAGYIGSQLVNRERILPDVVVGLAGAMAGGWSCYTFGAAGVNGLNLLSVFAAIGGSLICLLSYYAARRA